MTGVLICDEIACILRAFRIYVLSVSKKMLPRVTQQLKLIM